MSDLTANEARASVDRAKSSLEDAASEVVRQIEGRAWLALGYVSWSDMREAEYGGAAFIVPSEPRQELVTRLKKSGLTNSEIARTAGVDEKTIRNDIRNIPSTDLPETVTDSIGRVRPATYAPQTPATYAPQTPAPSAPSLPVGGAGTYSSPVVAVGAPTGEEASPAAESGTRRPDEPVALTADAPRPQVSPEERKRQQDERDHAEAVLRARSNLQSFIHGYYTAATLADNPLRDEVLDALPFGWAHKFLTIEKEIGSWPTI